MKRGHVRAYELSLSLDRYARRYVGILGCLILGLAIFFGWQHTASSQGIPTKESGEACVDPIDKCKKPVKFIERKLNCYTFACEYGTKKQRLIHTTKEEDVRALFEMEKEPTPLAEKSVPH
jgi:hypothetical protein